MEDEHKIMSRKSEIISRKSEVTNAKQQGSDLKYSSCVYTITNGSLIIRIKFPKRVNNNQLVKNTTAISENTLAVEKEPSSDQKISRASSMIRVEEKPKKIVGCPAQINNKPVVPVKREQALDQKSSCASKITAEEQKKMIVGSSAQRKNKPVVPVKKEQALDQKRSHVSMITAEEQKKMIVASPAQRNNKPVVSVKQELDQKSSCVSMITAEKKQKKILRSPAQINTKQVVMNTTAFSEKKKQEGTYEERINASSAKFRERYAEIERQKRKRNIEVVDFKNLPEPRQSKFACCRTRTRIVSR